MNTVITYRQVDDEGSVSSERRLCAYGRTFTDKKEAENFLANRFQGSSLDYLVTDLAKVLF